MSLSLSANAQKLSFALEQINAQVILDRGLTGKGVKVGIIDGGFLGANTSESLSDHFNANRVKYHKDFVAPDLAPYGGSKGQDDGHGTQVWNQIAGVNSNTKIQFGLATKAEFYLARTDHYLYERREEEQFMIQALDEMIRQGVQVINISLGYTDGYSRRTENYTASQMDGKSTWITGAIDSVLTIHDVIVVVSAGNDGNTKWQTLSAPSDSRKVLTVGATKLNVSEEMKYSSKGSKKLEYVKPDIASFSTSGTSFSAPIITGLIACLLEYDSTLTKDQIASVLSASSSLYPYPNNYLGYGIPNSANILRILEGQHVDQMEEIRSKKSREVISLGSLGIKRCIAYHKSENWKVIKKELIRPNKRLKVKKHPGSDQTTVIIGDRIVEILWTE